MQKRAFRPKTHQIAPNMSLLAPKRPWFLSDLIKYNYHVDSPLHYSNPNRPKPAQKRHFSKGTKRLKISLSANSITS
ncbi:hypothetical protein [uncultured Microscilla sp.]|uniref:hypothetical protein n=1 Tax=uncultured Microscilla sp. TaxID=432653 RepID=UPI0026140012|nr:hypothetical protein [uncultured Microscilla sp.]